MARKKSADSSSAPAAPKAKKTRWYKNIWQAYQMTRETDPAVTWWMLGAFLGVMAIATVLGLLWEGRLGYMLFVGAPFAILAMLMILVRRTESAAYKRIAGQPGAALSAIKTIRRGWDFSDDPVAMDMRTQDLVFRGVGRPGVVLVSEGPGYRVTKMLELERKKVNRILPKVPVIVIQCGDEEGQVPLAKLARKISRLRPELNKQAAAEVGKRLRALGGARMPVPKGVDPFKVRPDRKGMRGR